MTISASSALRGLCLLGVLVLSACSSPKKPLPTEVPLPQVLQDIQTQWTARVGAINFPLQVGTRDGKVALANGQGVVTVLSADSGKEIWHLDLKQPIAAGVGTDGQTLAVVTRSNQLVALSDGRELWRTPLPSESFTAPLVAGQRVFVLTADRTVLAFDAASGQALWSQKRTGDPLVLKAPGVLMPFKNTLLVGLAGRLVGMDSTNGIIRWELAIASPRGTNDVERLVDLIGPASRYEDTVCVRAFQAQIGCVNAERGQSIWSRGSVGEEGLAGNEQLLVAPLTNGVVQTWNRSTGERLWDTERLKYRKLSSPTVTPRGVMIADSGGWLYLLSLADGAVLNRIKLSGSELAAPAALAGSTYVLVTRDGSVTGLHIP